MNKLNIFNTWDEFHAHVSNTDEEQIPQVNIIKGDSGDIIEYIHFVGDNSVDIRDYIITTINTPV